MMSRKHYRDVATAIHDAQTIADDATRKAIAALARELADRFRRDNAAFRFDRFFEACGLDAFGDMPR